jgi:hypothetical protein
MQSISAVKNQSKPINAFCGQKLGFLNLKPMSVVTT